MGSDQVFLANSSVLLLELLPQQRINLLLSEYWPMPRQILFLKTSRTHFRGGWLSWTAAVGACFLPTPT